MAKHDTVKEKKSITTTTVLKPCKHCGVKFKPRGLASHEKACKEKQKGKPAMKKDQKSSPPKSSKTTKSSKSTEPSNGKKVAVGLFIVAAGLGVITLLLFATNNLFNLSENVAKASVVEEPVEHVSTMESDEFTPESLEKVSGYTIRSKPAKIVDFDTFTTSEGIFCVPIIDVDGEIGPYLGDTPPRSDVRPTSDFWKGSQYDKIKIVDDRNIPLPGAPLIRNTKTGNYKTHVIALVPSIGKG